jgi:hypothetical protein
MCQVGGECGGPLWGSRKLRGSSCAHFSLASAEEDKAEWEARSGSAFLLGTVKRSWGAWRLPERRGGCG